MKRNFFKLILGALALSLGFTSCKKDCNDCFSYTDDFGDTYTYCENEFSDKNEYDAYRAEIIADGYAVSDFENCD